MVQSAPQIVQNAPPYGVKRSPYGSKLLPRLGQLPSYGVNIVRSDIQIEKLSKHTHKSAILGHPGASPWVHMGPHWVAGMGA
jgi:hypothetical protein